MAVARTGRNSPPYVLILFVVLWVISTALAVLFYVNLGKRLEASTTTASQLAKFVSPAEMNNNTVQNMLSNATATDTVVGMLNHRVHELEAAILGQAKAMPTAVGPIVAEGGPVSTALQSAGISPGTSLLDAVKQLHAQAVAAQKAQKVAEAGLQQAANSLDTAKQTFKDDVSTIAQKLDRAHQQIQSLTQQLTTAQDKLATQATDFNNKITAQQQHSVADLRTQVVQNQQLSQELAARDNIISTLRSQIAVYKAPSQGPNALLSHAAGKVLSVSPGTKDVFLNIGSKEKVPVGLTFAVYNPELGVGSGTHGGGKGSVVVTQVGKYASVARITNVAPGQAIFAGDLISNPVFRANQPRKFHFVIYGDFNVNGNGVPTADGRLEVARLIKQWGGVVDKNISTQTDFLVLGTPPSSSTLPIQGATSSQTTAITQARAAEQKKYDQLIAEARTLSVPILNANRFLAMIGYNNTQLIQH